MEIWTKNNFDIWIKRAVFSFVEKFSLLLDLLPKFEHRFQKHYVYVIKYKYIFGRFGNYPSSWLLLNEPTAIKCKKYIFEDNHDLNHFQNILGTCKHYLLHCFDEPFNYCTKNGDLSYASIYKLNCNILIKNYN